MTRHGHHEGSIYKRSDGRWAATITLGYENGKRKRKTFYGETRKEVQEQLTRALSDIQHGLPLPNERLTVGTFLTRWLEESIRPLRRPKTYTSYAQVVRLYLQPTLGRKVLAKLSALDVQSLINQMLEQGLSSRTVQYTHALLRAALNKAVKWGLVARNVALLVDAPGPGQQEMLFLSPEEARSYLEAIRGDRLEALYTVALAVGLRPGEALGLRWQDVDVEANTLRVQVSLQRIDGRLVVDELKTTEEPTESRPPSIRHHGTPRAPGAPGCRAKSRRRSLGRTRSRVQYSSRATARTTQCDSVFPAYAEERGHHPPQILRSPAHLRLVALSARSSSARGNGDPRPQPDWHHDEYLQPRYPSDATGCG